VISFLEGEGLTRGYARYWNSHALTHASDSRILFKPVIECRQPASNVLCPFNVNLRTIWYRPQPGRSFLLIDTSVPRAAPDFLSDPPSEAYGPPLLTREFGEMKVFVYDYDIGSMFEPVCLTGYRCP
jgi:hypothetical protein